MKVDFNNPKTRIISDIFGLVIITILAICVVLYNLLLPNNTVITCDKDANECMIVYTSILGNICSKDDIIFKISNINEIKFVPAHRMSARSYAFANIDVSIKNIQNNSIHTGLSFYNDIIQPSINEEDTESLAAGINDYLGSKECNFYFNRNEEINPNTRKGFILGILIYYLIALILIMSDIRYYKNKSLK